MVKIVFPYDQAKDIRWYASEPTELAGAEAADAAAKRGETVTLEGNKYISWLKTTTSDGVCYALCAYWLALNSRGEDFWAWLGPGTRAAPESGRTNPLAGEVVVRIRNMMWAQKQGVEKTGSIGKFLEMEEFLNENSSLRNCRTVLCNSWPIKGKGSFFYISMNGQRRKDRKDFHHGIAARLDESGSMLFDPNHGDISVSGPEEINAFIKFLCQDPIEGYNITIRELNYMALT
ncbi:MAG: YopT-type cysteine protease domain-containing protein [Chloroflexota bacterium]